MNESMLPIDDPGNRRLPPLLRRAWYSLNQAFRRRIAHLDITPNQFTILRWLLEGDPEGLTQRELGDLMTSDPNTIASVLVRMERSGLVERHPHERDRRANRICILSAGEQRYHAARKIAVELQDEVFKGMSDDERRQFLVTLDRLADASHHALENSMVADHVVSDHRVTPQDASSDDDHRNPSDAS